MTKYEKQILRNMVNESFTWMLEDAIKDWDATHEVDWMKNEPMEKQEYFIAQARKELNKREWGF